MGSGEIGAETSLSADRVAERGALQRQVMAAEDCSGGCDVVAADKGDVLADQRRSPPDVLIAALVALRAELLDHPLGLGRILGTIQLTTSPSAPSCSCLAFSVWLAEPALCFHGIIAANLAATLATVELAVDRPAIRRVIAVVQGVGQGTGYAADLRDRSAEHGPNRRCG